MATKKQTFLDVASSTYTNPKERQQQYTEEYKKYNEKITPIIAKSLYVDLPISMVMRARSYGITPEEYKSIEEKVLTNPDKSLEEVLTPKEIKLVRRVPDALQTLRNYHTEYTTRLQERVEEQQSLTPEEIETRETFYKPIKEPQISLTPYEQPDIKERISDLIHKRPTISSPFYPTEIPVTQKLDKQEIKDEILQRTNENLKPVRSNVLKGGDIFYQKQQMLYNTEIPGLGISAATPFALAYGGLRGLSSSSRWRRTLRDRAYREELGGIGYGSRALGMISSSSRLFHTIPTSLAMLAGFRAPTFSLTGAASRMLGNITGASKLGGVMAAKGGILGQLAGGMMPYLPYMGLSMGLSIMKAKRLAKLQPKRRSGAEIEQKVSASSSIDTYLSSLISQGQIQPVDQFKIQLLKLIESHTSPIPDIYAELDYLRQEKDKGIEPSTKRYEKKTSFELENPFVRTFDTIEKKLLIWNTKYNPFQQLTDLFTGKTPFQVVKEIKEAYKTPDIKEEYKRSQQLGIKISSARLLKTKSSDLMRLAPTYEGKMLLLTAGIFDLLNLQTQEIITMRNYGMGTSIKNISYEDEYKNIFERFNEWRKEFSIEKLISHIPVVSGLVNLLTLGGKAIKSFGTAKEKISDFFSRSKEDYIREAKEKIIKQKTTQERAYEYVALGMPDLLGNIYSVEVEQLHVLHDIYDIYAKLYDVEVTKKREKPSIKWDERKAKYVTEKEYIKTEQKLQRQILKYAHTLYKSEPINIISDIGQKIFGLTKYRKTDEQLKKQYLTDILTKNKKYELSVDSQSRIKSLGKKIGQPFETLITKIDNILQTLIDGIKVKLNCKNIKDCFGNLLCPDGKCNIVSFPRTSEDVQSQEQILPKVVGSDIQQLSKYKYKKSKISEQTSQAKVEKLKSEISQIKQSESESKKSKISEQTSQAKIIKLENFRDKIKSTDNNLHSSVSGELIELKEKQRVKQEQTHEHIMEFILNNIYNVLNNIFKIDEEQLKLVKKDKKPSLISKMFGGLGSIISGIVNHPLLTGATMLGALAFPRMATFAKETLGITKWLDKAKSIPKMFDEMTTIMSSLGSGIGKISSYVGDLIGLSLKFSSGVAKLKEVTRGLKISDSLKIFEPFTFIIQKLAGFFSDVKTISEGSKVGKIASNVFGGLGKLLKGTGKLVGKGLTKILGKFSFLAPVIGFTLAAKRWSKGDHFGAAIEALSGILAIAPGIGTMFSLGLDGMLYLYDKFFNKPEKDQKGKSASEQASSQQKKKDMIKKISEQPIIGKKMGQILSQGGKTLSTSSEFGMDSEERPPGEQGDNPDLLTYKSKNISEQLVTKHIFRQYLEQAEKQKKTLSPEQKLQLIQTAYLEQKKLEKEDTQKWNDHLLKELDIREKMKLRVHTDYKIQPLFRLSDDIPFDEGIQHISDRLAGLSPEKKDLTIEAWLKSSPALPFTEGFEKLKRKLDSLQPQNIPLTFRVDEQTKQEFNRAKNRTETIKHTIDTIERKYKQTYDQYYELTKFDQEFKQEQVAKSMSQVQQVEQPKIVPIPMAQPVPPIIPPQSEEKNKDKLNIDPILDSLIDKLFMNTINSFQHEAVKYSYGTNQLVI